MLLMKGNVLGLDIQPGEMSPLSVNSGRVRERRGDWRAFIYFVQSPEGGKRKHRATTETEGPPETALDPHLGLQ